MKKDVAQNADEKLTDHACEMAQNQKKTLNMVFREWLEAYQARPVNYISYQSIMKSLSHVKNSGRFSRDDMNKR